MSKKKKLASEAVKWAFPDRGRESDMMRAMPAIEAAITPILKENEILTKRAAVAEKKKLYEERRKALGTPKKPMNDDDEKNFPPEKIFDKFVDPNMRLASKIEKVIFAAHN